MDLRLREHSLLNQLKIDMETLRRVELKFEFLRKQKHAYEEKINRMQKEVHAVGRQRIMALNALKQPKIAGPKTLEQLVMNQFGHKGLQALKQMQAETFA